MKRVTWITLFEVLRDTNGYLTSNLASMRYRVLMPIERLTEYKHRLVTLVSDASPEQFNTIIDTDVLIFSKGFLTSNEALAHAAKLNGARIIFDICDNHFDNPFHSSHYLKMAAIADQVVCNTPHMAQVAAPYCARPPIIIEDPYEGAQGTASFSPQARLQLLWFGHHSNLDSLEDCLPDVMNFAKTQQPLDLTVLTSKTPGLDAFCQDVNAAYGTHITMQPKLWSLDAQWQEIAACDAIIIPSLQNDRKFVKSANRMIEGLRAGKPVIAQPMPAYLPFHSWMPQHKLISHGLAWLMQNQANIPRLISDAQSYIEQHYAPAVIASQWESLLKA